MPVTIDLAPPLDREAELLAAQRGESVAELFVSLLKQSLKQNGNDPDQAWYWSPKWQQEEREAEEDLRNGHYRDFNSMDELINDLMAD